MNSQKEKFLRIFGSIDFAKIRDHPNILIAANFWDKDRYNAASIFYRYMRAIDDLIDNHKAAKRVIEDEEKNEYKSHVNEWLKMPEVSSDGDPEKAELVRTIEKFRIPLWPFETFARSMIYDINNDGFPTLEAFLDYTEGASIAPASIFVHLTGLTLKNGSYEAPSFDVKKAAAPCAIFSYLVHIIRDFQKDQLNNLNYFADDLILKNGLTRKALYDIAHGKPVTEGFRNLVREYLTIADSYRLKTRESITRIKPFLEERYILSLEIIFDLYSMVFEKIDAEKGLFTSYELNPTPEETRKRVYRNIMNFGTA